MCVAYSNGLFKLGVLTLITVTFGMQVVASLIQLQDLATATGRTTPLQTVVTVRHPRTIELINYITSHAHSNSNSSQSHSMQSGALTSHGAVTDSLRQQQSVHSKEGANMDGANHRGDAAAQQHQDKQRGHSSSNAVADVPALIRQHDSSDAKHAKHDSRAGSAGKKSEGPAAVLSVDVLLPDELLSGLLSQCSVQPELLSVMEDLFDSKGDLLLYAQYVHALSRAMSTYVDSWCTFDSCCAQELADSVLTAA